MKKIKIDAAKLQLHKQKIISLSKNQMINIHGGDLGTGEDLSNVGEPDAFTYSLSWGARCQQSKSLGANNPRDCGAEIEKEIIRGPF